MCSLASLLLSLLQGTLAFESEHTLFQIDFCQTGHPNGDYNFLFDEDEAFSVDLEEKEAVWRLPQFKDLTRYEVEVAVANMRTCESNLDIIIKTANESLTDNDPPEVRVYPEDQVEFGKSNILICFMDNFFPPVLNVSWYKNGELVSEGVSDTDFYHKADYGFRRFSFLVFTPEVGDIYSCHVEHWGLEEPLNKFWDDRGFGEVSELENGQK
ncbi:HLA class II histocompatibility antigen, DP alpha 1 chain-like [Latimeria chalumnae]|uniref:HLA class II histocompatibility antigen, DP alpha 1 chain-like n=1 Tax=Latimeria chalumnae TaxID=7897 RepID=UPI00313D2C60